MCSMIIRCMNRSSTPLFWVQQKPDAALQAIESQESPELWR